MDSIQLTHNQVKNNKTDKEIIVIACTIRTPENVGMLFRISEAFGVQKVILIGESPNLSNKKVLRTARSTEKKLNIEFVAEVQEIIMTLQKNKFQLIGLELTNKSTRLQEFDFKTSNKIAIFIGSERFGISNEILQQLDKTVHVDLFGENSSVNVVNAVAIALYEIMR